MSDTSSRNQEAPSPTRLSKGKGRSLSAADFLDDEENGDKHAGNGISQDYESALDAALAEDGIQRKEDRDYAELVLEEEEEQERFVYDGLDDEDTREFQEDASLDHKSYQERLRGVLEGEAHDEAALDNANGSEANGYPITQPSAPVPLKDLGSPRSAVDSVQSPIFSGDASPRSASSANISFNSDIPKVQLSAADTPPARYLPARRPPMNPLISRLRSTSGVPSLSPSSSFRSLSHSSSLGSLADIEGMNGFANDSRNSSFIHATRAEIRSADRVSRASSTSHFDTRANVQAPFASPSLSDFEESKDAYSSPPSISLRLPKAAPEVLPFRWTRLNKISQRLTRPTAGTGAPPVATFGEPTAMAASGIICLGTSKGWCAVFDYSQSIICVCGNEQIAKSAGSVTSVAISSDQTFVAVGHATGFIYLYALSKPQVPARVIQPVSMQAVQQGKAEGHLADSPNMPSRILYLSFVGSRHTAIVSGDSNGLAFYHSLGKVFGLANTDVLRILGKYPAPGRSDGSVGARKASDLLGMQALPLGTNAHPTDDYLLVAILTGVKLVVVGLKPTARTCFRAVNAPSVTTNGHAQPEDVYLKSGTLAWLPSIDGKAPMLAFTWGKELRVVQVEQELKTIPAINAKHQNTRGVNKAATQKDTTFKTLRFRPLLLPDITPSSSDENVLPIHSASEPVVALQWLNSRSILFLTRTHIEVLDIDTLQCLERVELHKQSLNLSKTVNHSQSLQIYKARIFFTASTGLVVGGLLSWADRILHLVETGDLISAIDLTVAYLTDTAIFGGSSTSQYSANLGLPADPQERRNAVEAKLREILVASADYVFSEERMRDGTHEDAAGQGRGVDRTSLFENLVDSAIRACLAMRQFDFLFDDLWERYSGVGIDSIFLNRLQPFVLQELIKTVPTTIVQRMLQVHEEKGELAEAEELIKHLEPTCLDVNQAAGICSRHRLYDALIYVYNAALSDFVGPFVELLKVVKQVQKIRKHQPRWVGEDGHDDELFEDGLDSEEALIPDAYKVYTYLADSLVGLAHPSKEPLSDAMALEAKISLYSFLFSGRPRVYPEGSRNLVETISGDTSEPTYPYLRLLLRFDAEAMLACLDIALEDSYLNEEASGRTPDRQQILNTLLDVMGSPSTAASGDFTVGEKTFLNIFVARNVPKYSQFVQLAQPTLEQVLRELASDPDMSTQEDRQLAAEYLLSAYTPKYDETLLQILEDAGFYRLLASIYRSRKAWKKLAFVQIRDSDQGAKVFDNLASVLHMTDGQDQSAVADEILLALPQLVDIGVSETASLVDVFMPERHAEALAKLEGSEIRQLAYLRFLLDPEESGTPAVHLQAKHQAQLLQKAYISLLCDHDPDSLVEYLARADGIDLQEAISICRVKAAFPAVIWCQAKAGRLDDGMKTLRDVLETRAELVSTSVLQPSFDTRLYIDQIVDSARMAITTCVEETQRAHSQVDVQEAWYQLLSVVVNLVRSTSGKIPFSSQLDQPSQALQCLTALLPEALSSLISSTSSPTLSFPRLVRRLMDSTSDNTYVQYRAIIDGMLGTYRFENDLLSTSNSLIQFDLHQQVADLEQERKTGWRPNVSGLCEACGKPVWSQPEETERYTNPDLVLRSSSGLEVSEKLKGRPTVRRRPSLKGKEASWLDEEPAVKKTQRKEQKDVVVFRGGAACHAICLQRAEAS